MGTRFVAGLLEDLGDGAGDIERRGPADDHRSEAFVARAFDRAAPPAGQAQSITTPARGSQEPIRAALPLGG